MENSGPLFSLADKARRCAQCGAEVPEKRRGRKLQPVRAERSDTPVAEEVWCNAACRDAWTKKNSKPKRREPRKVPQFVRDRQNPGQLHLTRAGMLDREWSHVQREIRDNERREKIDERNAKR